MHNNSNNNNNNNNNNNSNNNNIYIYIALIQNSKHFTSDYKFQQPRVLDNPQQSLTYLRQKNALYLHFTKDDALGLLGILTSLKVCSQEPEEVVFRGKQ